MHEVLKEFLETRCPLVSGKRIKVNFLGDVPQNFTVDTVPCSPIVKKYPDGGCLCRYLFVFASREHYDCDSRQNLDVCGFYEAFSRWIEEVNKAGIFPDFGEGFLVRSMSVLSGGYLFQSGESSARYQIQCEVLYEKEGVF